jgi:hypothetical protein
VEPTRSPSARWLRLASLIVFMVALWREHGPIWVLCSLLLGVALIAWVKHRARMEKRKAEAEVAQDGNENKRPNLRHS